MRNLDILRLPNEVAEPDPARILDALLQSSRAEPGVLLLRDGIPIARRWE